MAPAGTALRNVLHPIVFEGVDRLRLGHELGFAVLLGRRALRISRLSPHVLVARAGFGADGLRNSMRMSFGPPIMTRCSTLSRRTMTS